MKVWFDWANRMYIDGEFIQVCTDAEIYLVGKILGWYSEERLRWSRE
jgi:hypothetical protein